MILESIPDKTVYKDTTSHKFKQDLIEFFKDKNLKSCLEIGTNHGWTTKILSILFEEVHTIDYYQNNINLAKQNNNQSSNIKYYVADAYNTTLYNTLPKIDVAFIDCLHTFEHVIMDINNSLKLIDVEKGMYFIFDDYGHPESTGVHDAINSAISEGLKIECYIGQDKGYQYNSASTLIHREGIILSYGK